VTSRERFLAVAVAVVLLGLGGLFLHARSITPRDLRISEIGGDDVGVPVRVRGHVHRVGTTDEGNAAIILMDYADFAMIRVVARPRAVPDPASVAPGALVEVVGSVFGSGGAVQVFAEDPGSVTVRAPPGSNLLPLEFVARNAGRLDGHRVVVRATVADVRALVDPRHALLGSGEDRLWAYDPVGWTAGRANVTGRLVLTSRDRCELFVGPESYPVEATLAALVTCPDVLVGQPVIVRNVTVEPGEILGSLLTLKDLGDGAEFRMAAFVEGWDWRVAGISLGVVRTVEGIVEYQATEARWRILTDVPPRP
jgi:hypothetical protein